MAFASIVLALLLPLSCFAMTGGDAHGTSVSDESAKCESGGYWGKLVKLLSDAGKISDQYTILPRTFYKILLIFGEFDTINDQKSPKIEILTNEKGDFRWDFEEMVLKNESVAPKNEQKVTVFLCNLPKNECHVFRVYESYDKMKMEMAKNNGRFYGCFQVMYGEQSEKSANIGQMSEHRGQKEGAENILPSEHQNEQHPELPLSTFPAETELTALSTPQTASEASEDEADDQRAEEVTLIDGHKKYLDHYSSLRQRKVGQDGQKKMHL